MSNITMEELKAVSHLKQRVYDRCLEVMEWLNDHDNDCYYIMPDKNKAYGNSMYIDIGDNDVEVTVSETWGYGGREDHYYDIPFEWIVNDDWHEDYLKKVEEKRLAAEKKRKLEEERKQQELEDYERSEYERLKIKYEILN